MAADIIAGVKVVTKLIGAGMSLYRATSNHDDLEDAIKAIQGVLDAGAVAAATWEGAPPTRLQARHMALVVAAFGDAWSQHFAPRLAFEPTLEKQKAAAIQWALTDLPTTNVVGLQTELERLDRILSGVLQTPYYLALWESFTLRDLPDVEHRWTRALIEVVDASDQRAFETLVRRAYAEALASDAGTEVRTYLAALATDRSRLVLELMVRDLATWGRRHVFGNVANHARLPSMPLSEMYVEPWSAPRTERSRAAALPITANAEARKVLSFVEDNLSRTNIVVVTAHFGHGKSLSARVLANRWAVEYLESASPKHGLPIFVKCSDDLNSNEAKLPKMVERALWRQVGLGLKLGLKDTDSAFSPPRETDRAVFLVDGLDEVALTDAAVIQLFEHLRGQATENHKIVVFSRPEILPEQRLRELEIPVIELLPFSHRSEDGNQIAEWIEKWNTHCGDRPKLSFDEVTKRGLIELAHTPILLFMIAETWGNVGEEGGMVRQADLYEAFLSRMARGKHEADRDSHKPIAEAANKLHERLIERSRISADSSFDQAMLWALSRIAWESYCLEQREKPLTQRKIIELLDRELDVNDESAHQALCDGVLLALQADFSAGSSRILFGHRSFREFLVARYWERCLWQIITRHSADWRKGERYLLGGRLMGREDRSFDFLLQIIERWESKDRRSLCKWGEQTFNDERLSCHDDSADATLIDDRRSYLREAALAIGSCVAGSPGIEASNRTVLRSLIAWFWARGEQPIVRAPSLRHPGARLNSVSLVDANFRGADLQAADLSDAQLSHCNFAGANLGRARLSSAHLSSTNLDGANLNDAQMTSGFLYSVSLVGCSLRNAMLAGTGYTDCTITRADFSGADLRGGTLSERYLRSDAVVDSNTKIAELSEVIGGIAKKTERWMAEMMQVVTGITSTPEFYWFTTHEEYFQGTHPPIHVDNPEPRIRFQVRVSTQDAEKLLAALEKLSSVIEVSVQQGAAPRRPKGRNLTSVGVLSATE